MTDNPLLGKISIGLGIASLVLCLCCGGGLLTVWIPILCSIIGLVLSFMANDGNAKTGMIINITSIVLTIIWCAFNIIIGVGVNIMNYVDPYMLEDLIYIFDM